MGACEISSVLKLGFHVPVGPLVGCLPQAARVVGQLGSLEEIWEGVDDLGAVSTKMKSQVWGQCV